jgi:hypothetical protein
VCENPPKRCLLLAGYATVAPVPTSITSSREQRTRACRSLDVALRNSRVVGRFACQGHSERIGHQRDLTIAEMREHRQR